ncbi:MAG: MBL fold metallo-hydrolase [Gammaproteobacteria bacterium]|nr:MBL fold metallo-hydrolase [Gammaproteobacteria bacterium]
MPANSTGNEFTVTLLGTGCPAASERRFGPSALVQMGGRNILVDAGSGVTQRLAALGLSGADIDALLITHLHTDHVIDLYQLIISSWHKSRDRKWMIYGPRGFNRFVENTMQLWQKERELRIKFEQRTSTVAFDIEVIELNNEEPLEFGEGLVKPVLVEHKPVVPAWGFSFAYQGRKAVISGDTRYCENLIHAAQNADLLVHEVFVHDGMEVTGTRTAKGLKAVASYHTLSTEVGQVAAAANARALCLTHLVPPDADTTKLITQAAKSYSGPVIVGEDLMTFDLLTRVARKGEVTFGF